jgi:hypothetical protein
MSTIPTIVNTTTTSTSVTSGVARIGLSAKPNAAVGDAIIISGVIPTAYNGKFTVTAVSNVAPFSVSFVAPTGASGPQTKAGSFTRSTYSSTVATTAASTETDISSGRIFATVQLASLLNVAVGDTIIVKGVTPSGYNSATSTVGGATTTTPWTVTSASSTPPYSVTYLVNSTLGPQTNAGTVALAVPKTSFYTGDFSPVGATIGALGGFTQNVIEEALKSDFLGSSGWFPLIEQLWEGLDQALALPIAIIKKIFEVLILEPLKFILPTIDNILDVIANVFGLPEPDLDTIEGLMAALDAAGKWLFSPLVALFSFIKDPVTGIVNVGQGVLRFLFGTFDATKTFLQNLITSLLGNANATLAAATDFIKALVERIVYWITHPTDAFGMIAAVLSGLFKTTFDNTKGFIENLIKAIFGTFTNGLDFIGHLFKNLFGSVTQGLDFLGHILKSIFGATFDNAIGFIGNLFKSLFGSFTNGLSFVGHLLSDGVNFFSTLLSKLVSQIVGAILGPNAVAEWSSLTKWASNLINFDNIFQAVQNIWYRLINFLPVLNTAETDVNLIIQGSFKTASTMSAANGWAWDSTTNNTAGGSYAGAGVGGTAKVTAAGADRYLYCNQVIPVTSGDTMTFSAYVKTASLTRSGSVTPLSLLIFPGSSTTGIAVTPTEAWPLAPTTFTKISGTYTVPAGVTSVRVAIGITSAALSGSVWFDDVFLGNTRTLQQPLVRELTSAFGGVKDALNRNPRGTTATTTMDYTSFFDTTTATTGLIGTIQTKSDGNQSNLQTVVDNIAQTVGGSPGAVNQAPATVNTSFQNLFGKLYGQGTTVPQNTVPQASITSLPSAFGGLKDALGRNPRNTSPTASFDYNTLYDTTTATTGLIGTASSNAAGAKQDTQAVTDYIAQTVGGNAGAINQPIASVSTNFTSFFNKLYGANTPQNTVPQTKITELTGAFGGVKDALSKNPRGTTPATTLDYTSFFDTTTATTGLIQTIDTRVTTTNTTIGKTNNAVFGSTAEPVPGTSKLSAQVIPDTLSYSEGSGAIVRYQPATPGSLTFNAGRQRTSPFIWNVLATNTSDITVRAAVDAGTFRQMRVTYAGWYMAEICYGLNVTNASPYGGGTTALPYSFNIAPVLYTGPGTTSMSAVAVGQDAMQVYWATSGNFAWSQRYAKSSFIVYLQANWYVAPGYDLKLPNDASGNVRSSAAVCYADGTGTDFYFSLSLLNKSLA